MKYINKIVPFVLIIIAPVVFYGMFFNYTIDVPVNDDYHAILDFLNKCISTNSLSEKIKLIFSQHNEHRIVYDRLWTIVDYKLNGQVDFNHLALIGNLALIGIFYIFYRQIQYLHKSLLLLLPVSVLLFNISLWENMTFAMATMSNITIYLFSLSSIYFATKQDLTKGYFILSCIFFVLATFTQGGGLFLAPILAAILLYQRRNDFLIIFLAVTFLTIGFYFYGYVKPGHHPDVLDTFIAFKVRAVLFALAFLGNAFAYFLIATNDINDSVVLCAIIGFIFFGIYLYAIKSKYYKKNLFVFSIMSLLVLCSIITGITRCQFGLETAVASRYRINGIIFTLSIYIWFIETKSISTKKMNIGLISASLFYLLYINVNQYEYLSFRKYSSLLGMLHYHSGDHTKLNGDQGSRDFYKTVLTESYNLGTYYPPTFEFLTEYFPYSEIDKSIKADSNASDVTFSLDGISKIKDSYLLNGFAFINDMGANGQKVYIGMQSSDSQIKFYLAKIEPRFDLNPYFKKFNLKNAGYVARIPIGDISSGSNKIYIKIINRDITRTVITDKVLEN